MDAALSRIMAAQHGFFYRRQALDCGVGPKELQALVTSGEWVRLRRGAFTTKAAYASLDATGVHVLHLRAITGNLTGRVVAAGVSALAVLGLPLWGLDLEVVHVLRDPGVTSRTDAKVVHHVAPIPDDQIVKVAGLEVATAERSVIDAARSVSFESAVVLADGARRLPSFDGDLAKSVLESQRDWPGSLRAGRARHFSDGAAETVGESRSRVMIARLGLPAPQLQKVFYRSDGSVLARSDFYFEQFDTIGEFDGKQKYGRSLYETSRRIEAVDPGEVVWQEKRREDALRDEGNEIVRWVWSELDSHDAGMKARFQRAFDRGGRRNAG